MPDDLDHEVIDSPQALFRHLYEAHGLVEALDLDPATAPLQFWLRRHAELEVAASRPAAGGTAAERRSADRSPAAPVVAPASAPPPTTGRGGGAAAPRGPATPGGAAAGSGVSGAGSGVGGAGSGVRFRPFADPLVEAVAVALVGRGLDERWVRRGLSTYTGTDGRHGEEAVRAAFVAPMLEAVAAQLGGGPPSRPQWPPTTPRTTQRGAAGRDPTHRAPAPRQPPARDPARPEPAPWKPAAQEPAPQTSRPRGTAGWEPAAPAGSTGRAEGQSGGRDTWAPQPLAARAAGPDLNADFMAIADVLQERRRSRRGGRRDTTTPRASAPPATTPPGPREPREPDDDVMALANALQRGRGNRSQ